MHGLALIFEYDYKTVKIIYVWTKLELGKFFLHFLRFLISNPSGRPEIFFATFNEENDDVCLTDKLYLVYSETTEPICTKCSGIVVSYAYQCPFGGMKTKQKMLKFA